MRGPIARAKALQGFVPALQRPGCRNCGHVEEREPTNAANDLWALRCAKGGFGVTAFAICTHHKTKEESREPKQPLVA